MNKRQLKMIKYVITGGPCTGKTSVINELEKRGFAICNEVAREMLKNKENSSFIDFETQIFKKQLQKESELEDKLKKKSYKGETGLFLDRGLIDIVAYSLHHLNSVPAEIASFDYSKRYNLVFILDGLPFINDGIRLEKDANEAEEIHKRIMYAYHLYGYSAIKVPVFASTDHADSVRKRADFILSHVKDYAQNCQELKGGEKEDGRML